MFRAITRWSAACGSATTVTGACSNEVRAPLTLERTRAASDRRLRRGPHKFKARELFRGIVARAVDVCLAVNLENLPKVRRFVKGLSITVGALAFAVTVGAGSARADSRSCEQGHACELGAKPSDASFKPGKVDGAALWQSDGYANVWFTSTAKGQVMYKVAICNAASVEEVMFEGGSRKDTKVASPKGKLSGCDVYSLATGLKIDGLRIKAQGNSFKLYVLKNDDPSGYSLYLEDAVLPARDSHYMFRVAHH